MTLIKGRFVVMNIEGVELGFQDSCTLSDDLELLEKASATAREYIPNKTGATASVSGLIGIENGELSNKPLVDALRGRTELLIEIINETASKKTSFNAFCVSHSEEHNTKGYSTYSAQFTVNGAITVEDIV